MLKKFEVENFRNFKESTVFDFSKTKNYEFNQLCIKNGLVNKAIIYGENGSGKSNLGLAIFDLIGNLTDKNSGEDLYGTNYQNANRESDPVRFKYTFVFNSVDVVYEYEKKDFSSIINEKLLINGDVVVEHASGGILKTKLPGTETLNKDLNNSKLSALKYVRNNTVFVKNNVTDAFVEFFKFVDGMLYFRSLLQNSYIGFSTGSTAILNDILEKNHLNEFQVFLNDAGIDIKIKEYEEDGRKSIGVCFENGKIMNWSSVVSTGTKSLVLFYFWLQYFDGIKFIFIDEFDAYYHHNLSKFVVTKLLQSRPQTVITTHNTNLMSNDILRPDCCLIMDSKGINPVFSKTEKELRYAHNLEKMYIAGALDD